MAKLIKRNKVKLFPFKRTDYLQAQGEEQNLGWEITAFNLPDTWKYTQG